MFQDLFAVQSQPLPSSVEAYWAGLARRAANLHVQAEADDSGYYRARAAAETARANAALHGKAQAAHVELALGYRRLAGKTSRV